MNFLFALIVSLVSAANQVTGEAGWIKQKVTPPVLTMILTLIVFVLILSFALRFMTSIRTPVQFADKSLALNKEY